MSNITRLFQALDRLGIIGERPHSDGLTVTVTNHLYVTLILKSEKAITTIVEALEAAVPTE